MTLIRGIEKTVGSFLCALSLTNIGCAKFPLLPSSVAETASGYTYIPIDPSKVEIVPKDCRMNYGDIGDGSKQMKLLDHLPDNAVRLSMELSDAQGQVTYGVSKIKGAGSSYKLTADYVNSDTVNKMVHIAKSVLVEETTVTYGLWGLWKSQIISHKDPKPARVATEDVVAEGKKTITKRIVPNSEVYRIVDSKEWENWVKESKLEENQKPNFTPKENKLEENLKPNFTPIDFEPYSVPIYVGIGLRIIAEGTTLEGDVNISGIGVVGAEAEAKRVRGSLMVQTLGVNGQAVASALPVNSELSRTTAENAFVAIGSIKALLHQLDTKKFLRVVGMYLPFPGGKPLVNALISELSRNPVDWCPLGQSMKDAANPAGGPRL